MLQCKSPLLANNGHEPAFRSRPVYTRKRTYRLAMSVSSGKADAIRRRAALLVGGQRDRLAVSRNGA